MPGSTAGALCLSGTAKCLGGARLKMIFLLAIPSVTTFSILRWFFPEMVLI